MVPSGRKKCQRFGSGSRSSSVIREERSGGTLVACRGVAAATATRARSDASESAGARLTRIQSRSRSRARVAARRARCARPRARDRAPEIARGTGFRSSRTHLATTCCLRTAFTETERLTVVEWGIGGRRSVRGLESLAKPETSSASRVSVVSARPRRVRDARMKLLVSPARWVSRSHVPGSAARREEILRAATLTGAATAKLEATMAAIFVVVWCA